MADQIRRVGLLKAVGAKPRLVADVLLAEYVVVALVAAAVGVAVGWLTAPLLTEASAGLLGSAGAPTVTLSTVGLVTAVALAVAVLATFIPAVRASRTSTGTDTDQGNVDPIRRSTTHDAGHDHGSVAHAGRISSTRFRVSSRTCSFGK